MRKKLLGVGTLDAGYNVSEREVWYEDGKKRSRLIWSCPYYNKWRKMLERCYSKGYQDSRPTYGGKSVCDNWLTFSNFRCWMEKQDWQGKVLDKDLINPNSTQYCPENCVFVSYSVNNFIINSRARRGQLPVGVSSNKGRFVSRIRRDNKLLELGSYSCPLQAHRAWQHKKVELCQELIEQQTDPRVVGGLVRVRDQIEEDMETGKQSEFY